MNNRRMMVRLAHLGFVNQFLSAVSRWPENSPSTPRNLHTARGIVHVNSFSRMKASNPRLNTAIPKAHASSVTQRIISPCVALAAATCVGKETMAL